MQDQVDGAEITKRKRDSNDKSQDKPQDRRGANDRRGRNQDGQRPQSQQGGNQKGGQYAGYANSKSKKQRTNAPANPPCPPAKRLQGSDTDSDPDYLSGSDYEYNRPAEQAFMAVEHVAGNESEFDSDDHAPSQAVFTMSTFNGMSRVFNLLQNSDNVDQESTEEIISSAVGSTNPVLLPNLPVKMLHLLGK